MTDVERAVLAAVCDRCNNLVEQLDKLADELHELRFEVRKIDH